MQSLCAGYRVQRPVGVKGNAHWRVEGSQPHRVKGETPCPRRIVALRQFVLGSTCRKIRRFNGFAAAPLRGNSTKIGGKRIETDTTQWQSRKNGTYNPKHNDRRFDVEHSEHINPEMTKKKCLLGLLYRH